MVTILGAPRAGEIVSPGASKEMLADPQTLPGLHRHPPHLGPAPPCNKTGALDALRSDVGIVYSKGGRIAMAITVDDMPKPDWTPDNPGSLLIADLAKMLVEGFARK